MVSYDINGNVIDSVSVTEGWHPSSEKENYLQDQSFYSKLESKVNYYALLDSTYSLTQGSVGSPRR